MASGTDYGLLRERLFDFARWFWRLAAAARRSARYSSMRHATTVRPLAGILRSINVYFLIYILALTSSCDHVQRA
jgi:hypothetical protein